MKITKNQLRRIIKEALTEDRLPPAVFPPVSHPVIAPYFNEEKYHDKEGSGWAKEYKTYRYKHGGGTTGHQDLVIYYKTNGKSIEHTLIKRIFNALPTNITYNEGSFSTFLEERDYISFAKKDTSAVSFYKFRLFLRRYELQQIEKEFLSNINIKLSLLP